MADGAVLEQHRSLVSRFLDAVAEDFRVAEAIARNASAIVARQQARGERTSRE